MANSYIRWRNSRISETLSSNAEEFLDETIRIENRGTATDADDVIDLAAELWVREAYLVL